MNSSQITVAFSIHYQTSYGEELYVILDDSTSRKLTWRPGHIWVGSATIQRPRTLRWSYTLQNNGQVIRRENLIYPRQYKLDKNHKFFHLFDRWDNSCSNVSPLTIHPTGTQDRDFSQNNKSQTISPLKKSQSIITVFVRIPQRVRSGF
ncbi:hypothetical protein EIN_172720 [Entamoeba invadens IP1]|uniref:Uncharacterized protein n=1 Tax=Entamoeba invadens IP1 TaxID=370355 RepID=A0A0A1TVV9_ENTIV|nr:hypothetical protein EIN_172720 [Entamoeba invadens IP1]ELP84627.1 hypothetical protein EIN_172720 [Entamoeba invadens IP1]|eukprot:XP_004183973.1 hypothetical protein EIN_172720 [Entamoeba invadens IP1]